MISLEGSIANMTCRNTFTYHLKALHLIRSLMIKIILHKLFVRKIDSLYVYINHYPQHVLCFFILSYLCVMHFFSV